MKDRGRILRKEADAKRVEGRTKFNPRALPLFRCRLTIQDAAESPEEGGLVTKRPVPQLMTLAKDTERNKLEFRIGDSVEVESRDLGVAEEKGWHLVGVFEVEGEPKPIRKKRRVIGWELRLARLDEDNFDRGRTT